MSRRFILIDPSLKAKNGDRWHYAVGSARDAHARGMRFVLLTHRDAPSIASEVGFAIDERRLFEYAFYEHERIYTRHRSVRRSPAEVRADARAKDKLLRLDERIRVAQERGEINGRLALESRRDVELLLLRVRGLAAQALTPRRKPTRPFNRDQFGLALASALDQLRPGPTDEVFLHMVSYGMLESLAEVSAARANNAPHDVTATLILHFGAEAPDARTYLGSYGSYAAYGSIADRLKVGSPFARVRLLATCGELQEEAAQIVGAPIGRWAGLVDMRQVVKALGPADAIATRRAEVMKRMAAGRIRFVARAADLDAERARTLSRACHVVQNDGLEVELRLMYNVGSVLRLRDILSALDYPHLELVSTDDNDRYLQELADASLAVLAYDPALYEKRVSGVLHDCAVLGVPALVPAGTTLATCPFATTFAYASSEGMADAARGAVLQLAKEPGLPDAAVEAARLAVAGDVLTRMSEGLATPSLTRWGPAPIANVVMPLWGRVGSSFAMEAQVRYLLSRGYFVNQVFVLDKPVEELEAIEYFWRMLKENSSNTRGCVQRVAYVRAEHAERGRSRPNYLASGAFRQYVSRIARASTHDAEFDRTLRRAAVTVVNHVFNAGWAFAHCGGRTILETHDIQSYGMVNWPLLNDATGQVDPASVMLADEFEIIRRFDHVVNVAPEEHRILSIANPNSSLVTPYVPERQPSAAFRTVAEMASRFGWHDSYLGLERFDLLLAGDAHPANVESAMWFVEQVFVPHLAPRGLSLAVVGRLSDTLYARLGDRAYVFYVGFVDDLESVKALTRLVVLPDQRGTGISIKTLDAFASGKPFVATRTALRGLRDRLPPDCLAFDVPSEMAEAIVGALDDDLRLNELGALARRCYEAVASQREFDAAWDTIVDRLSLPRDAPGVVS